MHTYISGGGAHQATLVAVGLWSINQGSAPPASLACTVFPAIPQCTCTGAKPPINQRQRMTIDDHIADELNLVSKKKKQPVPSGEKLRSLHFSGKEKVQIAIRLSVTSEFCSRGIRRVRISKGFNRRWVTAAERESWKRRYNKRSFSRILLSLL